MTSEQFQPGADPPRPDPFPDPNPHQPTNRPVVVIVHGIRDFALWQNTIRSALEEVGFDVEATNYGRLNLLEFVVPITYFRKRAIETVWRQIRIIKQTKPHASISVIAHSFGTFVISQLMKENFDIQFDRIIFCGSVVPYGFEYEQIQSRFRQPIINEVGTRDIWPAMAESITWGYGSAGTYGFRRPLVRDRWHNGAGHGYFLNRAFCMRFWVPFLKDGKIAPGAETPERPRAWLQFVSIFRLKYLLVLITSVLVVLLYNVHKSPKIAQVDESIIPPITTPLVASFLGHLSEIASSPLAFVGYLTALAAWVARGWSLKRPEQQAKEIISTFKNDRERREALGTLLGERPPDGLKGKAIIDWVHIKTRQKAYIYILFAYVCTLITALAIIGMATYSFLNRDGDPTKPPILIQEKATHG